MQNLIHVVIELPAGLTERVPVYALGADPVEVFGRNDEEYAKERAYQLAHENNGVYVAMSAETEGVILKGCLMTVSDGEAEVINIEDYMAELHEGNIKDFRELAQFGGEAEQGIELYIVTEGENGSDGDQICDTLEDAIEYAQERLSAFQEEGWGPYYAEIRKVYATESALGRNIFDYDIEDGDLVKIVEG